MNDEPQPTTSPELLTMSPEMQRLRDLVIKVAVWPEYNDNAGHVIRSGSRRQSRGARFIFAQITSQRGLIFEGLDEPYSDHVLELYACDSLGDKIEPGDRLMTDNRTNEIARGSVQVVKIQEDGQVIGIIDNQEFKFNTTTAGQADASEFITAFYRDNYLDQLSPLDMTFSNT